MGRLKIRLLIIVAMIMVLCPSCVNRDMRFMLDDVESYISERPDSALSVLESIRKEDISGRKDKAKFALLYSMALDKNAIDVKDDSLVSIATDWYAGHGTPDERLKAFYYHGRVLENAGDNEGAMEKFVLAESESFQSTDNYAKGLLYSVMAGIYEDLFEWQNALKYYQLAKTSYEQANNVDKAARALLRICNIYLRYNETDSAEQILEEVNNINGLTYRTEDMRALVGLYFYRQTKAKEQLSLALETYLEKAHVIDWSEAATAYMELGEFKEALQALDEYVKGGGHLDAAYYIRKYELHDSLKQYDKSLLAYKRYSSMRDSILKVISSEDTKFLKERYENRIAEEKKQKLIWIICLCAIVFISVLMYIIYKIERRLEDRKKERQRYLEEIAEIEIERDSLKEIVENNHILGTEAQSVMKARLDILNHFLSSSIRKKADEIEKASGEIDAIIDNKTKFLRDTRIIFSGIYPEFITVLKSKGLSDGQIEICCLYALGLKGKDVINYTNRKRHYIDNMDIRDKLGLDEHSQNLDKYIQSLLKVSK